MSKRTPAVPDLFPHDMTIGEKYEPAMLITEQAEADAYFERCVEHTMRVHGSGRAEAEKLERANLGYYAGYGFDRERVERLFRCAHPVFGSVAENGHQTADGAFVKGALAAREASRK